MLDHVFDRRDGRDVSLIAALRAEQVHHVLGRVHVGIRHVTVFIRVGMSRLVPFLSFGGVFDHVRHFHSRHPVRHFALKHRGKRRGLRRALKHHVAAPVGSAFRRARSFGIGQVLHQKLSPVRWAAIPEALTESTENRLIRIGPL